MKVKINKGSVAHTPGGVHMEGEVVDLPAVYARKLIADGRASEYVEKETKTSK